MRRLWIVSMVIVLLGVSYADALKGTILPQGKWSLAYENGSQTVATNAKDKFQVNSLSTLGVFYGLNEKWNLGWEVSQLGILAYPSAPDKDVSWTNYGGLPGSLLVEYYVGKVADMDFKVKLKQLLTKRLLVVDKDNAQLKQLVALGKIKANTDAEMSIQDTNLMFIVSKEVMKDITLAGSMDLMYLDYEANEDVLALLKNDNNKTFVRFGFGANYLVNECWLVYLYMAKALDSNAVGTYVEDTLPSAFGADSAVLHDNYGVVQVGVKRNF